MDRVAGRGADGGAARRATSLEKKRTRGFDWRRTLRAESSTSARRWSATTGAHSSGGSSCTWAGRTGFSREIALDAVGAGAYSATVPLSRPGTYIAVARDEISGEAVGTTGAVLTAGEEPPTGSDLALLSRIAELSGGKRRDTLAGIFGDRALKALLVQGRDPHLPVLLAAFGLLFAVAARKLAFPEGLGDRLLRPFRARPRAPKAPVDTRAPEVMFGALLDAKGRAQRTHRPRRKVAILATGAVNPRLLVAIRATGVVRRDRPPCRSARPRGLRPRRRRERR